MSTIEMNNMQSRGLKRTRSTDNLERLLMLTLELQRMDNWKIWLSLLDIYCKDDTSNRVMELFVRMQEAGYPPFDRLSF